MPILSNERHEKFANLLVQGKKQLAAYTAAGFAKSSKSAGKLYAMEHIQARIKELQQLAVAETTLSQVKVLNEMEKLGFSNMMDFIKIEDGEPVLDFSRLTREQAAAIGEITTDVITNPRTGEVTRRTKFKLLDKKGALVDLGRYLGMWVDRKEVKVGGILFHINVDDAAL